MKSVAGESTTFEAAEELLRCWLEARVCAEGSCLPPFGDERALSFWKAAAASDTQHAGMKQKPL